MDNKTKYNPAIHHRRSIRLKGYDYSKAGLYFITICTHNRECLFGEIIDQQMILNDAGKIADECWLRIPEHFPNAVLHEHVVMPNHVHGIIGLANHQHAAGVDDAAGDFEPLPDADLAHVEPLSPPRNEYQKIIPRSIGSIVRGYKIGVTKFFRANTDIYDVWHGNFHEHIIRNEQSYWRISEYIIDNPKVWKDDKFYRE